MRFGMFDGEGAKTSKVVGKFTDLREKVWKAVEKIHGDDASPPLITNSSF